MRTNSVLSGLWLSCALLAAAQADRKLTPRELFYSAPAAAPAAAPEKPKPAAAARPAPARAAKSAKPKAPAQPAGVPAPPQAAPRSQDTPVMNVAYSAGAPAPLGLRYSILKIAGGQATEVDADTVFHSGDRIRLSVEVNDSGYLYIVNRGSSGAWRTLFPSAEIEGGSNAVARGRTYELPSGYTFTFDEQAGTEKLFIVFSRRPEPDLENLIYTLQQPAAAPERPAGQQPKLLLASNMRPIDDGLISRFRTTYARDLIIEKVDENTPGGQKREKAIYTVNPAAGADGRVVADVSLKHE